MESALFPLSLGANVPPEPRVRVPDTVRPNWPELPMVPSLTRLPVTDLAPPAPLGHERLPVLPMVTVSPAGTASVELFPQAVLLSTMPPLSVKLPGAVNSGVEAAGAQDLERLPCRGCSDQ